MTDEPTKDAPDQPAQPASQPTPPPPPPSPPTEPSGVGFAAIQTPGQPGMPTPQPTPPAAYPPPPPGPVGYQPPSSFQGPPSGPPPGPPPGSQPPPPPPPGPVSQYDYSRMPPSRGSGPSVLLIGGLGFVLVLVLGAGAMFALGLGPFARATPTPTLVAQPSPTIPLQTPVTGPTATPTRTSTPAASATAGVTASAGPTATPIPSGDITDMLLSHIPSAIAPTCFVTESQRTILALATCSADDGDITLTYFQYDSHDSMFTTYEGFRLASQIEPNQGDCTDPASWPTENPYNISGQPAGRWLCTEALGETSIYWTDDRLNILSQATHTQSDYARLVDFWVSESGPNL